jgi:hypothetical protein
VSTVAALLALLAAAYLGSFLVGTHGLRGRGLPSGAEYVAAGFLIGPAGLEVAGASVVDGFSPFAHVAVGWVALALGLDYGFTDGRRTPAGRLAGASVLALATGAAVAGLVAILLARLEGTGLLATRTQLLVAGGAGAVLAGTTRRSIAWVAERYGARGPLTELLADLSDADDLLPLVAAGLLLALDPAPAIAARFGWLGAAGLGAGLGVVLGLGAALLIRGDPRQDAAAAVLFGVSLLGIGLSVRAGLSAMVTSLFVGLVASAASGRRDALRALVHRAEHPIVVPALLLAGAMIDPRAHPHLLVLVLVALAARLVAKLAFGPAIAVGAPAARRAGPALGLALASSGPLAVCIGLSFALARPGPAGGAVLAIAAAGALAGEFVTPLPLRRTLRRAGEIEAATPAPGPAEEAAP